MSVMNDFVGLFKMPAPLVIAAKELAVAELELLKAETSMEYANAVASYNRTRIERLKAYLALERK